MSARRSSRKTSIRGGRLVDPSSGLDATRDLHIAGGRIVGVGKAPSGFKASVEIDARGKVVIPGLVDLCARVREPGQEHKATIESETRAAASGGITTLCCPPDTLPESMLYGDIGWAMLRSSWDDDATMLAVKSPKDSAQSPPWRTKASPLATRARADLRLRASPAKTRGG